MQPSILTEGECVKPPTLRAKAQGIERLRETLFNLLGGNNYLSIARCHTDCTGRLDPKDVSQLCVVVVIVVVIVMLMEYIHMCVPLKSEQQQIRQIQHRLPQLHKILLCLPVS